VRAQVERTHDFARLFDERVADRQSSRFAPGDDVERDFRAGLRDDVFDNVVEIRGDLPNNICRFAADLKAQDRFGGDDRAAGEGCGRDSYSSSHGSVTVWDT